jgi:metallo-beta-lactamase family protein
MVESTYGNRDHRSMDKTIEEPSAVLLSTWQQGGDVLIPAFAVGRTQELLFYLR